MICIPREVWSAYSCRAHHGPYFCLSCDQPLETRRGPLIRDYFAHWRNALDRDCPLLAEGGHDVQFEKMRNASVAHATNRLRLFLRVSGYQNEARLYGVLPSLTTEDLTLAEDAANPLQLSSEGTTRPLQLSDFSPAAAQAWIELTPGTDRFEVHVRPPTLSIGGRWRAEPIGPGGLFVGDERQAEYVCDPRRIATADYVLSGQPFPWSRRTSSANWSGETVWAYMKIGKVFLPCLRRVQVVA